MNAIIKHGFDQEQIQEQIELIKSTLMAGKTPPTDNELALFGMICHKAGLDPFAKQIYAIQRYDAETRGQKWTFQVSVDGLRAIADRTGQYAGSDEPLFDEGLDLYEFEETKRLAPKMCKVTVWKIVAGQRCPFVGVARYSEFVQKTKEGAPTKMWREMPLTMLAKCAESQALRKAFPQCNNAQSEIDQSVVDVDVTQVDGGEESEQWRIDGFEWGVSQGVNTETARNIANVSRDKKDLHQRMTASIPAKPEVKIEA